MERLLDHLSKKRAFTEFEEAFKKLSTLEIAHADEAIALFFALALFKRQERSVVVVFHNFYKAQKAYEALREILRDEVVFYPQDEFLTTDMLAMSEDLKFERIETLDALLATREQILVTHTTGLIKHILPPGHFKEAVQWFSVGDDVDIDALKDRLIALGYRSNHVVEKIGDFAQRGSIFDLFPPGETDPVRLDFFDTEIDSMRHFDIDSQRSKSSIKHVKVLPRTEFFYTDETAETIHRNVDRAMKRLHLDETSRERIQSDLSSLGHHEEKDRLSRYMSFSDIDPVTVRGYLEDPFIVFMDYERVEGAYQNILEDFTTWKREVGAYGELGFDVMSSLDAIEGEKHLFINPLPMQKKVQKTIEVDTKESIKYHNNFHMLIKDLRRYEGRVTVLVTLADEDRMDRLMKAMEGKIDYKILGKRDAPFEKRINLSVTENPLSFEWFDADFVLLSDSDIFEKMSPARKKKAKKVFKDSERVSSVDALEKGDYIVHYDHGIGRFLGVKSMEVHGQMNDYILIGYRGDDKLYVPVENIHRIQKYVAHEGVVPRIHKLGSTEWAKTKRRVRKRAKDIARQLITLYAQREKSEGFAFSEDGDLMQTFEAEFMYEETPDQRKAIEAVKRDMEKSTPMDRLICGDVGYGKTEVALRAAFKASLDNKQTVYLAPTTVLSRQHYYTFKERLNPHGIRVALLNRFVDPKKQRAYLKGIEDGNVDVIIGTHRILSKDIEFDDLGLLIIDEEQRFGVEHKERIKQLKLQIDVLSLSATPIPRTLQMAMTDVKQMSVIETPPQNRFPVQTYVLRRSDHVIKDAIEREIARDGQVFYLHNRIESIDAVASDLQDLVPDARIGVAHGQMNRHTLEHVMQSFLDHAFDVLVTTTIIETGIDIANANTLIVHDADKLGLAQLYQIRGRVGRSNRVAYSYLMYDKHKQLSEDAAKRLQAIKEFTELGSGYRIAQRDLAIRGAGDLLGTEQSGFIDSVGIDLFMEMVREEIDKAQDASPQQQADEEEKKRTVKLETSRTIPKTYIPSDDARIEFHKKIASLKDSTSYRLLVEEAEDRFGPVPESLKHYMREKLYEQLAVEAGVEKVKRQKRTITFTLSESASKRIRGDVLFERANTISQFIHLSYKHRTLHITLEIHKLEQSVVETMIPLFETILNKEG